MKLKVLITLRELAYRKTPLTEIVKSVAAERPDDIEVISSDTTSHTYIRTGMDRSEFNQILLSGIADQMNDLDSHLEDLSVTPDDAVDAVRNADPFIFFQVEPSFRKTDTGNVFYVEPCSA